jgi:hypothetical protein
MEFPLISRALIANLKLVHGLFNFAVMCLFVWHGRNGLQIRRARQGKLPLPLLAIRRHRKSGPVLAALGIGGFFAGLTLVFLDTGRVLSYPAHLLAGTAIVLLLASTYQVSKKITAGDTGWREVHFRLGIAILSCYLLNVILGIGVLL